MSTKAKSTRKPLTPAQKAAKAEKAKATRERKAAEVKAAEEQMEEATEVIPDEEPAPEETEVKAEETPIEEPTEEQKAEEVVAEEPKAEKPAKSIRPAKQPKVITFNEVMKKWGALVDILKAYSNQQQKLGRAWRHIYQGYHVVNQHMLRFKRNKPE